MLGVKLSSKAHFSKEGIGNIAVNENTKRPPHKLGAKVRGGFLFIKIF